MYIFTNRTPLRTSLSQVLAVVAFHLIFSQEIDTQHDDFLSFYDPMSKI